MIVWSTLEASCPICANRVRLREVGSGFTVGQDSDLLVRMRGKHIIQAEVHTCNKCHFSGSTTDFLRHTSRAARHRFRKDVSPTLTHEAIIDPAGQKVRLFPSSTGQNSLDKRSLDPSAKSKRKARLSDSASSGSGKTPLPDVQYYWAFRTAAALALPPALQGQRLLRAYWCLRLPPSVHLPPRVAVPLRKIYLKGAIQKLRQSLRFERDRNVVYLVAELCRRNKNFLLSISYFRRFLEREEGAPYLKHAATKLLIMARDKVSDEISMEQLLYDQFPDPGNPTGEGGASLDAG